MSQMLVVSTFIPRKAPRREQQSSHYPGQFWQKKEGGYNTPQERQASKSSNEITRLNETQKLYLEKKFNPVQKLHPALIARDLRYGYARKKDNVKQFKVRMFLNIQQGSYSSQGNRQSLATMNPKMVWTQAVKDDLPAAEARKQITALFTQGVQLSHNHLTSFPCSAQSSTRAKNIESAYMIF